MRRLPRVVLLCLPLLLAGCTLGPEESGPADPGAGGNATNEPDPAWTERWNFPGVAWNVTPATPPGAAPATPPGGEPPAATPEPPAADPPVATSPPATPPAAPPPGASPPLASPPPATPPATPSPPPSTPPATPPPATPPATSPPTPPAEWPREGSYVRYTATAQRTSYDGQYAQRDVGEATWTFTNGDWTGTCTERTEEYVGGRGWQNGTSTRTYTAASPPHWPPMNTRLPPAEGQPVTTWHMEGCDLVRSDDFPYAGTDTEPTSVRGRPVVADTHVARTPETDAPQTFRTEWSRDEGIVLTWGLWRRGGFMTTTIEGRLVDTDAPLG